MVINNARLHSAKSELRFCSGLGTGHVLVVVCNAENLQKQPPVFEACNLVKNEGLAQVLSYEFCEILRPTFLKEHLQ